MMKRKITLKLAALGIALTCLFACAAGVLVACNQEPQKRGEFYTLQEAYDAGLLTTNDLKSIACYLSGDENTDGFIPAPKVPAELSSETEQAIKETRAYDLRHRYGEDDATAEDVNVIHGRNIPLLQRQSYLHLATIVKTLNIGEKFMRSNKIETILMGIALIMLT